jgi:Right handed beta helix region
MTKTAGFVTTFALMTVTLSIILSCSTAVSLPAGNVYYVGKTGSNRNSCSEAQNPNSPKQTITGSSGGISCLSSGDTLVIKAGVYNETYYNLASGQPNIPGGSSSSNLTVIKGEGVGVTIWKPGGGYGILMKNPNNYIGWQGFTLDCIDMRNAKETCFKEFRQDTRTTVGWHITDLAIVDAPDNAMFFGTTSRNWIIERTEIKNPGRVARRTSELYNWIYGQGSGHIVRDNYLYHTSDITPGAGAGGLRIASNAAGDSGPGKNLIERNFIRNVRIGIIIGANDTNIVRNNVIIDTTLYGIQTYQPTWGTEIYNNTIAARCSTGIYAGRFATNTSINNNIIFGCAKVISDSGISTIQARNFTQDPLFTNPEANDFTLQKASPAIGTGAMP